MIPVTEFVGELRKRMAARLEREEEKILEGGAYRSASAAETALAYAISLGRVHAMREVRNEIDLLVKQMNSGEL